MLSEINTTIFRGDLHMRCVRCGGDYVGMKKVNKFNCPHCGGNK